jgi:hypothetical protein
MKRRLMLKLALAGTVFVLTLPTSAAAFPLESSFSSNVSMGHPSAGSPIPGADRFPSLLVLDVWDGERFQFGLQRSDMRTRGAIDARIAMISDTAAARMSEVVSHELTPVEVDAREQVDHSWMVFGPQADADFSITVRNVTLEEPKPGLFGAAQSMGAPTAGLGQK